MARGLRVVLKKNRIGEVSKSLVDGSRRQQVDTAQRIRDGARQRVHVITGHLRDSIAVSTPKSSTGQASGDFRMIEVRATAPYAGFEEEGTRFRPAHPFLRPAVEAERGPYVEGQRQVIRSL